MHKTIYTSYYICFTIWNCCVEINRNSIKHECLLNCAFICDMLLAELNVDFKKRKILKDFMELHISKYTFLEKTTKQNFCFCNQHVLKFKIIALMRLTFTSRSTPHII